MELLIAIIVLLCTFYILKNLLFIYAGLIPKLIGNPSRTEDGNHFIYFMLTIIVSCISVMIILIFFYKILGGFYPLGVILAALFFKFGTNKGVTE